MHVFYHSKHQLIIYFYDLQQIKDQLSYLTMVTSHRLNEIQTESKYFKHVKHLQFTHATSDTLIKGHWTINVNIFYL